jgi:hypothetical protein
MLSVPYELELELGRVLSAAVRISGDLGNLQLLDPACYALKIVCQTGFDSAFLKFFSATQEGQSACGEALLLRQRVVIEDVATDALFAGTEAREVLLAAGVRAVQSTPLLNDAGQVVGVLSTHYRRPMAPSAFDLVQVDKLAAYAGKLIEPYVASESLAGTSFCVKRGHPKPYATFIRVGDSVSFLEVADHREQALERLETLSLLQQGEYVLFHNGDVIAVASSGHVEQLDHRAAAKKAALRGGSLAGLAAR